MPKLHVKDKNSISTDDVKRVISRLKNNEFNTYDFIEEYKKISPNDWKLIESTFSPTGKGKGRFTARSVAANALKKAVTAEVLEKLDEREEADSDWEWGHKWITRWRITKNDVVDDDFRDEDEFQDLVKKAGKLDDLDKKVEETSKLGPAEKILKSTTVYKRNPFVVAWVIRRAIQTNGMCECCNQHSFKDVNSEPYLEVHHVIPLSDDGPDTTTNAIAVCPNCHRELHYGNNRTTLREKLYETIERLSR